MLSAVILITFAAEGGLVDDSRGYPRWLKLQFAERWAQGHPVSGQEESSISREDRSIKQSIEMYRRMMASPAGNDSVLIDINSAEQDDFSKCLSDDQRNQVRRITNAMREVVGVAKHDIQPFHQRREQEAAVSRHHDHQAPTKAPTFYQMSSRGARRWKTRESHKHVSVPQKLSAYSPHHFGDLWPIQSEDLETLWQLQRALIEKADNSSVVVHAMDRLKMSNIDASATLRGSGSAQSNGPLDEVLLEIMDFVSCFTLHRSGPVVIPWRVREWIIRVIHTSTACNETRWLTKSLVWPWTRDLWPDTRTRHRSRQEALAIHYLGDVNVFAGIGLDVDALARIKADWALFENPVLMRIYLDLFSGMLEAVIQLQKAETFAKYMDVVADKSEKGMGILMSEMQLKLDLQNYDVAAKLFVSVMNSSQSNVQAAQDAVLVLEESVGQWNHHKMVIDTLCIVYPSR